MVRPIVTDPEILHQKSKPFVFGEDDDLIQDMMDTANEHKERCIGLAAIQIGVPRQVILARRGDSFLVIINPKITLKSRESYCAVEACMSVDGEKSVNRSRNIMVSYYTRNGVRRVEKFNGRLAQIIQHEVDHLNGILIGGV